MLLSALLRETADCRRRSGGDPLISGVAYDSRLVQPGNLFVALRGLRTSGDEYIGEALKRGAAAVVTETVIPPIEGIAMVMTGNARKALAELSWAFFGHPELKLSSAGFTGTNGKTTSASLVQFALNEFGWKAGLVGTLGVHYGEMAVDSPRTTPESADLAQHFAEMIRQGFSHAVMEATSIGIDLERTWRIPFRVVVFTNLSRDHLDYHHTEEAYRNAKLRLFSEMETTATAVINRDDPSFHHFVHAARGPVVTYGMQEECDLRATDVHLTRDSVQFAVHAFGHDYSVRAPLIGRFNVHNLLAAMGTLQALGMPLSSAAQLLARAKPVPGRAERIQSSAPFSVIVDYAHTPDALEKILTTLKSIPHRRVITVVGAGGDRDPGKRPLMAAKAFELSDLLILTSDNPRSEDPEAILDDLWGGLPKHATSIREVDRARAIKTAILEAREGDIVLIAGKGHETYQEINGVRHPFDDRVVSRECLIHAGFEA